MSKIILYIAVSLDGFVAKSDGDISWLDKYQGGEEDYGYSNFYKKIGACIMGTKTYEKALTFAGGIDKKMPTYVVTHRKLKLPADADITLYSGNLSELLKVIQRRTRKNVWLVGGGQLAQSFLKECLIDKIILSTIPVILGEGISLFGNVKKELDLVLIKAESYESGIVQAHYSLRHGSAPRTPRIQ